jgi:hypothetical protein
MIKMPFNFRIIFIVLLLESTLLQVTQQQTMSSKIEKRETFLQPFMRTGYLRPKKVVTQAQYNQCVRECLDNRPSGWG